MPTIGLILYATRHDPLSGVSPQKKGWRIGSGPTEAMCKTTTVRLKRCGMRWDADNADPIAPGLAGLEQSDLWELYWQTRVKPTG